MQWNEKKMLIPIRECLKKNGALIHILFLRRVKADVALHD